MGCAERRQISWHYSYLAESEKEEKVKSKPPKQFNVGELVWGPHGTFPSWPGKLVRFERDGSKVLVCWFGNRDTSQVNPHYLKSLSDGLEAHHRERKKLRKWVLKLILWNFWLIFFYFLGGEKWMQAWKRPSKKPWWSLIGWLVMTKFSHFYYLVIISVYDICLWYAKNRQWFLICPANEIAVAHSL